MDNVFVDTFASNRISVTSGQAARAVIVREVDLGVAAS
jgi:hypothetical protein